MPAGTDDLTRATTALASRLPLELAPLAKLAYNYRWSWLPDARALFRELDPHRFELTGGNPVRMLQEASIESLARAASDPDYLRRLAAAEQEFDEDLARPPSGPFTPERPVAFFCAEYAVHQSLPIYSGGLGALSGDFLKEASDRALPLVAVGLLYRQGYFRQRLDASGWQHEHWDELDPERVPAALVTGADGEPVTITVPIRGVDVTAQIWRVDVGRVPLFLLDADRPENEAPERWVTARLYVADPAVRLEQYVLLGVGGVRALRALGIDPALVHLNEGHASFAALELAQTTGGPLADAFESARARTAFTTHTPVPAGNDTYPAADVVAALEGIVTEPEAILREGRSNPEDAGEPFGVTQFALRRSATANGVSRRHGEVAREMWQHLWPEAPLEAVPIGHVTNGVHVPSWLGEPMRRLLDRHLEPGWLTRAYDPNLWEPIDDISDEELWAARAEQRAALVEWVRRRSAADRLGRGESREYALAAAHGFDPEALTIGFARRLATYKRLRLIAQDAGRALSLLAGERPIQVVLAGKAHPSDDEAKHVIQTLFAHKGAPSAGAHVVYLHDYDLRTAARLVQGCDVWVNLPRPPLEASGTSGMKSAVNGGLQLSVLDGWWAEGYDGDNGWALSGEVDPDNDAQDARHAAELYRLLEEEVVPAFYERDDRGLPTAWLARMRASLRTLPAAFSTGRMLEDYLERVYSISLARRG